jgi:hypothetical protein
MAVSFAAPPVGTQGGPDGMVHTIGDLDVTVTRVTLDNSYPTGGYAITAGSGNTLTDASNLGLRQVQFADCALTNENAANPIVPWYEASTGQLKMYTDVGEAANGTNFTGVVVQIIAYGRAR